ncbi:MAG: cytotoxic translational repressor of toxin-antitoxin stability system [Actinomycetota bacterium]|nr:cytotoxic translational repressor of toxin-antitoxin stability system [Actinomycetota bacterium]
MSGAASRREHKRFCDVEGWQEVTSARGGKVSHHITYELALADGQILRTRISRPANNDTYGPNLWSAILRDQLCVGAEDFWQCIGRGTKPPRPKRTTAIPQRSVPAGLVHQLISTLGMSEQAVAALTRDEAIALMTAHWSKPPT